jgi:hypothetical protein
MQQDASTANAKQLVAERVRQSTNILVAVSANPSVDALAAALGLALILNKLDKHATAVFSGAMPPAMEFLNPGKTFEHSVDSLRDFIISLDKEKADRLRYKVEDDVVRIFITPYRSTITEKDLQFSQGDFNVELILALGVEKREDLDKAIVAHGRILHDATVVTLNAGSQQSSLGAVDWHEPSVSSLCEMLMSLAESLQQPGLLDQQIATALLTGIVAATDRFSNEHTTPRVMTMAAQLMAAGANQQLIANNLVKAREQPQQMVSNGQLLPDGPSVKVAPVPEEEKPKKDGELDITHPKKEDQSASANSFAPVAPPEAISAAQPAPAPQAPAAQQQAQREEPRQKSRRNRNRNKQQQQSAEDELSAALPSAAAATSAFDELKSAIEGENTQKDAVPAILKEPKAPGSQTVNGGSDDEEDEPKQDDGFVVGSSSWRGRRLEPPVLGGTLNATTEQAMDDSIKAQEEERNQKLLTHPDVPVEQPKLKGPKIDPPVQAPKKEESKPEPTPTAAVEPMPAPNPEVSKEASVPEPVALAPTTAPASIAQPTPAPEPSLPPPPSVTPAPMPEPTPTPASSPEPAPTQPTPEPEVTANEAAAVAKPADATGADLDAARQAVSDALSSQPFNPAGQPLQSAGAMPLGTPEEPVQAAPVSTSPPPMPEPPTLSPLPEPLPAAPSNEPQALPPLPPMPPLPQQDPTQPLPPPPSLNDLPPLPANSLPPAPVPVPPEAPAPEPQTPQAPPDPKQFQIPTP